MSTPKFAETHNLVAFLEKPKESNGFEEIIDFLNTSSVQYALTVNPTIYTTCIEQFWTSTEAKTINGERQIQALVDKKKVIITEMSIRSDLKLNDVEGTYCLPTATIFAELERMGMKESRRKQRKDSGPIEPVLDEAHVSTPSYDPPESGEDKVTLVDETQEMNDDNLMFDTSVLEEHECHTPPRQKHEA
ncbi:hypothetical protein Tco_0345234 [Tanacetum coccineum]